MDLNEHVCVVHVFTLLVYLFTSFIVFIGILQIMSCFGGDLNFCPECGNVLPIPGLQNFITCPRCDFKVPVVGETSLLN